ncbi:MAG: DUF445 family protein, partial [Leptolyngbya sp. Prado105]|nr:DUF445 family protein [Leptolyngbya sp. Prado105]
MDLSTLWLFVGPPVVGGVIGYFTNDIAIKMLFRPYRAVYIGRRRVPFTPGLIPRNQERLAKRISDTIMGSLLTPEELQNLARRLLQPERVQAAILWLLRLSIEQLQESKEQKTAKILGGILRDLFGQSLPRLLKVLARQEEFLEDQLNHIFDQVILEFQLSEEQAEKLSQWLVEVVIPPDVLRQTLVDFLTDRNIQVIDEGFREKTSGTYWVVANLFGVRNTLTRLRTFCLDEKENSNTVLAELTFSLGVKQRFKEWLRNLSLQNLPVSTVRQLRKTMRDSVRHYLQERGSEVLQGLSESVDWENVASIVLNRLQNSEAVISSQIEGTQSTLLDLLDVENDIIENNHDVEEVTNYVRAHDYAFQQITTQRGLPVSLRLIKQAHKILMEGVRGQSKSPGEFRKSQNWVGGVRPSKAIFVPPPVK